MASEQHQANRSEDALKRIRKTEVESPGIPLHEARKRHAEPAGDWPEPQGNALIPIRGRIAAASKGQQDQSTLAEILLAENDEKEAWREARANACPSHLWLRLAEAREKKHPGVAPIFLMRGDEELARDRTSNYNVPIALLLRAAKLMKKISALLRFQRHLAALREQHKSKRKFLDLLNHLRARHRSARWHPIPACDLLSEFQAHVRHYRDSRGVDSAATCHPIGAERPQQASKESSAVRRKPTFLVSKERLFRCSTIHPQLGNGNLVLKIMSASATASAPDPSDGEVTRLLNEIRRGDKSATDKLVPIVYDELHRLARRQLRSERSDHTLQTTALVNEAYLKLTAGGPADFNGRAHFFAVASQVMRQVLVDSARARLAGKRGGGAIRVELTDSLAVSEEGLQEALVVHEALAKLEKLDPRQVRIVEMYFYVGLGLEEIADALGLSSRTVKRDWKAARAWLFAEIGPQS